MPWQIAAGLVAMGAVLAATGLRQGRQVRSVRSWTRTVGRVLESRLEEQPGPEEQGFPQWRLVVRYAYQAHGQERVSDRLWIGARPVPPSRDRDQQQRWADRFPAGAEVTVWFDPADPRQAVLVPEVPRAATSLGGRRRVGSWRTGPVGLTSRPAPPGPVRLGGTSSCARSRRFDHRNLRRFVTNPRSGRNRGNPGGARHDGGP